MVIIGSKSAFGIEIFEVNTNSLYCEVDIYLSDRNISADDNMVYIPGFVNAVEFSLSRLKNHGFRNPGDVKDDDTIPQIHHFLCSNASYLPAAEQFLLWGSTTNRVISFLIPKDDELFLSYEFHQESSNTSVGHMKVSKEDLILILEKTINELTPGPLARFRSKSG